MAVAHIASKTMLSFVATAGAFATLALAMPDVSTSPIDKLQLVYHATFGNGSLDSGVDPLGLGKLALGDSQIPGSAPAWTAMNGAYIIEITRPNGPVNGIVSTGIFAVPVDFDSNAVVGAEATFVAPSGPHTNNARWATTVSARTGGVADLGPELRNAAALQVNGNTARLNVVGASPSVNLPSMPQEMYDAIFDPVNPQPFTLKLLINRQSGVGKASLTVMNMSVSTQFQSGPFPAGSGPTITALGVSVANATAAGERVTVSVRDFKIFTSFRPENTGIADSCPSDFGCRKWPTFDD